MIFKSAVFLASIFMAQAVLAADSKYVLICTVKDQNPVLKQVRIKFTPSDSETNVRKTFNKRVHWENGVFGEDPEGDMLNKHYTVKSIPDYKFYVRDVVKQWDTFTYKVNAVRADATITINLSSAQVHKDQRPDPWEPFFDPNNSYEATIDIVTNKTGERGLKAVCRSAEGTATGRKLMGIRGRAQN